MFWLSFDLGPRNTGSQVKKLQLEFELAGNRLLQIRHKNLALPERWKWFPSRVPLLFSSPVCSCILFPIDRRRDAARPLCAASEFSSFRLALFLCEAKPKFQLQEKTSSAGVICCRSPVCASALSTRVVATSSRRANKTIEKVICFP